jgi:hypothetical protein
MAIKIPLIHWVSTISFLFLINSIVCAQKYDYQYLQRSNQTLNALLNVRFCDVKNDMVIDYYESRNQSWIDGSITINDKEGQLLGYFNGLTLYGADNLPIRYGEEFGMRTDFCRRAAAVNSNCAPIHAGLILPIMEDKQFILLTSSYELKYTSGFRLPKVYDRGLLLDDYCSEILVTKLLLNEEGVLEVDPDYKEVPLMTGFFRMELTACKHANGKDWWILAFDRIEDQSYSILLTEKGDISIKEFRYPGENATFNANDGAGIFSPDGSKYAKLHYRNIYDESSNLAMPSRIEIMDFNRCTGELGGGYYRTEVPVDVDHWSTGQLAFSQSGRFLYYANTKYILQYDLEEADYFDKGDTIATTNGLFWRDLPWIPNIMPQIWRLPNGTMAVPWADGGYMHIIKEPDKKGKDCNFIYNYLEVPNNPYNPENPSPMLFRNGPWWPDYRMSALEHACEETSDGEGVEDCMQVLPNPFNIEVILKCLEGDRGSAARRVEVFNVLGQLMYQGSLVDSQQGRRIDTFGWPSATYLVVLRDEANGVIKTFKMVKQ